MHSYLQPCLLPSLPLYYSSSLSLHSISSLIAHKPFYTFHHLFTTYKNFISSFYSPILPLFLTPLSPFLMTFPFSRGYWGITPKKIFELADACNWVLDNFRYEYQYSDKSVCALFPVNMAQLRIIMNLNFAANHVKVPEHFVVLVHITIDK